MRKLLLFLVILLSAALAACGGESSSEAAGTQLADLHDFPVEVQKAPVSVQQAYQFAVANADLIQSIPCYCGCGAMGHTSNYSCYVSGENQDGSLKFDEHALGCSICVDITLDAMRLQKEGKSIPDIRQYIDDTYAPYGPSNMP